MKKLLLVSVALVSISVISCRQEEMLSTEDMATLKIIEKSNTARFIDNQKVKDTTAVKGGTTDNTFGSTISADNDGDPVPPPRL